MAQCHGPEAVRLCIEAAVHPGSLESSANDDAELERLAALSQLDYERIRKSRAKALGVRPSILDKMVYSARKDSESKKNIIFPDNKPWPEAIQLAELLTQLSSTVKRFVVCPPETADAAALWIAMTWIVFVIHVAPIANITAATKRCGKTILLTILGKLVYRPIFASNISPAALFRAIDAWSPTLLIDEVDVCLKEKEELRGIINSGHTRDTAFVIRTVGDTFTPTRFSTWGPKALAGIGRISATVQDRSITFELSRKLSSEKVEKLRYAEPDLFPTLTAKLARFAEDYAEDVRLERPELPECLNDRAQDNWEPLLAIADVAGGEWPELARAAAIKLSGTVNIDQTVGIELLADIRGVFQKKNVDRLSTVDLIAALVEDEEKPWATFYRGAAITPRQLAKLLNDYGITSNTVRFDGGSTFKGFRLVQFADAFSRYLPDNPLNE